MKRLAAAIGFFAILFAAVGAKANDSWSIAVEGAYYLVQTDKFHRILSFDRGGVVTQISDQQTLIGFSTGRGAWEQIGPGKVRARVIDFDFDPDSGKPIGPAVVVYDLTFSDLEDGKYQKVIGSHSGEQYASGQNPLNPTEAPTRTFNADFAGKRITVE